MRISKRVQLSRNLMIHAINHLLEENLISLDDPKLQSPLDEAGMVLTVINSKKCGIGWHNIGFGELQVDIFADLKLEYIRARKIMAYEKELKSYKNLGISSNRIEELLFRNEYNPYTASDFQLLGKHETESGHFSPWSFRRGEFNAFASCWLERKTGKFIQGVENHMSLPHKPIIAKDINSFIHTLPVANPNGYSPWGRVIF